MKNPTLWTICVLSTMGIVYLGLLNESAQPRTPNTPLEAATANPLPEVLVSNDADQIRTRTSRLNPKTKTYRIDPNDPRPITCKQGTRLDFSNTSFVYDDGTPVLEPFDLSVAEYYTTADIIRAKLTTTSDGRMLETGGMVNLEASNKKGRIRIAESSTYQIAFPRRNNPNDDFELFYGQWSSDELINWKLANNTIDEETIQSNEGILSDAYLEEYTIVSSIENPLTGEIVETRIAPAALEVASPSTIPQQAFLSPSEVCFIQINKSELRRDERISKMDYFNWQLTNGQTLSQWFGGAFNPNLEMVNDFCKEKLRSEITFQVDEEGKFKSYYISHTCGIRAYDEAIAAFLQTMPPLRLEVLMPKYVVDHACILSFGSHISHSQDKFTTSFRAAYGKDSTATLTNVNAGVVDYYVMSSSELGWINCDRFVQANDLVDFQLQLPESNCFVALIFDRYNSILRGDYTGEGYTFSGIPNNEPMHVLVLNTTTTTPQMAYIPGNTRDQKLASPPTRPFALHELDGALREM